MRSKFSHFVIFNSDSSSQKLNDDSFAPPQWRWLLNLGIGFLVCGLIAIALPQFVTSALNILFGILLLLIGLATAMYAYRVRHYSHDRWPSFTSLAFVMFGFMLILFPKVGALSITLIIAIFFLFIGIGKISLAQLVHSHSSRKWILLSGLIDLVLSFLIFFNLGNTADWLIGLLLGISLILQGWWNIRLALSLRKSYAHQFEA